MAMSDTALDAAYVEIIELPLVELVELMLIMRPLGCLHVCEL